MKKTRSRRMPVSAKTIARQAENGQDTPHHFTNSGKMTKPIQRVNVDFTTSVLEELEAAASELNISRHAIIKTVPRQAQDQR
jgi:ribosomal protein L18E